MITGSEGVRDMCASCLASEEERARKIRAEAAKKIHEQPYVPFTGKSSREREWDELRRAAHPDLEALLRGLLAELGRQGRPGLERVGPYKKPLFGKKPLPTGPLAYPTFYDRVDKGMVRAEPFRPMVQHYVTPDGRLLEQDGTPARHAVLPKTVVALYERVEKLGTRLPVSQAIAASPDWPRERWPATA